MCVRLNLAAQLLLPHGAMTPCPRLQVEAGDMDEAVSLLKEGLNTFEPMFPNRWAIGEQVVFLGGMERRGAHADMLLCINDIIACPGAPRLT
mgnify:CR=1 FL=1